MSRRFSESPYVEKIKEQNGRAVWNPTLVKGMDGFYTEPTFTIGRVLNQGVRPCC